MQRSTLAIVLAVASGALSVGGLAVSRASLKSYEAAMAAPVAVTPEAVREAILANPRMLVEAGQKLQLEQRSSLRTASLDLAAAAAAEIREPQPGVLGNPAGLHEILEFFDYRCPHCREISPFLAQAVKDDPELKIVLREIPVLGEGSEIAARAALASEAQGGYSAMHDALMSMPEPITAEAVSAAAQAAGLDPSRLLADMASEAVAGRLRRSLDLSVRLGVTGTPAFAAPGAGVINGISGPAEFRAFVAAAAR